MGESIELRHGEQLRMCDGNGRTIGVVLSPGTLEQMTAERDQLREEVGQLRKQLDEAQRQITLLEQDWQSMFRLLPRELQVTEEDIREAQRNSHTIDEVLQMLEQYKPS